MSYSNRPQARVKRPGEKIIRPGLESISVNNGDPENPLKLCEDCRYERDGSCWVPKQGKVATECELWWPRGAIEPIYQTKLREAQVIGI